MWVSQAVPVCGLLVLLVASASAQQGMIVGTNNPIQTAAGLGSAVTSAVQNAIRNMPGGQVANAMANALPVGNALRNAAATFTGGAVCSLLPKNCTA